MAARRKCMASITWKEGRGDPMPVRENPVKCMGPQGRRGIATAVVKVTGKCRISWATQLMEVSQCYSRKEAQALVPLSRSACEVNEVSWTVEAKR